jgi:K+-transporting ATPase ATPase C chain
MSGAAPPGPDPAAGAPPPPAVPPARAEILPTRGPAEIAPRPARSPPRPPTASGSPPVSVALHLRATAVLLVLTVLAGSLGYPLAVTAFAQLTVPGTANGSLLYAPNGTAVGSTLVASNLTAPWLFWPRPSPVDFDMFNGAAAPPGPADPALVNETIGYLQQYGENLSNASLPLWLVSSSGSGVDPDITPPSALIQIPRVSLVTHLSEAYLLSLVNSYIVRPGYGLIGPSYVDVVSLDLAVALAYGR